jgi:SsrA-binding protein
MAKQKKSGPPPRIANRKAFHDYHVLEKLECGIQLTGSEVKSVRDAKVQLGQGFARVEPGGALMLYSVDIAVYSHASSAGSHEPQRPRKLLAHKRQIVRLATETSVKGTTLVPLSMYFNERGIAKVEIGLVQGKRTHDKRESLKARDADRDIRRAMTRKTI